MRMHKINAWYSAKGENEVCYTLCPSHNTEKLSPVLWCPLSIWQTAVFEESNLTNSELGGTSEDFRFPSSACILTEKQYLKYMYLNTTLNKYFSGIVFAKKSC